MMRHCAVVIIYTQTWKMIWYAYCVQWHLKHVQSKLLGEIVLCRETKVFHIFRISHHVHWDYIYSNAQLYIIAISIIYPLTQSQKAVFTAYPAAHLNKSQQLLPFAITKQ